MTGIWGKVIGGALGFVFGGGPLGAAVGLMAGHAYDTGEAALTWGKDRENDDGKGWLGRFSRHKVDARAQTLAFNNAVVVLGAKMAKADGKVTRVEIDAFKRVFNITPAQEDGIGQLFDRARRSAEGFEPYAFQLAQNFRNQPVVLENILHGLFVIAAADSPTLSMAEVRFLRSIAYIFNFSPETLAQVAAKAQVRLPSGSGNDPAPPQAISRPYAILGVTDKASNEAVKTAYRKLIRENHPDKLAAEGKPPNFVAAANEKMKTINAAYDEICRMRGIK